ncbi:TolC family protein [Roseomonas sp. GCM10028921]
MQPPLRRWPPCSARTPPARPSPPRAARGGTPWPRSWPACPWTSAAPSTAPPRSRSPARRCGGPAEPSGRPGRLPQPRRCRGEHGLVEAGRSRDLAISGGVTRTELSQDLPNSARSLRATDTLGIGLSVPIFTSRIVEGNIAVAAAQRGQAQAGAALAGAQADLATAWASLVQARSLLDLTTGAALRRAEEAYRSTEAAYAAGGRTLLDTLDALRTLNQTRVAANAARAAYLNALAGLEQASGVAGISLKL